MSNKFLKKAAVTNTSEVIKHNEVPVGNKYNRRIKENCSGSDFLLSEVFEKFFSLSQKSTRVRIRKRGKGNISQEMSNFPIVQTKCQLVYWASLTFFFFLVFSLYRYKTLFHPHSHYSWSLFQPTLLKKNGLKETMDKFCPIDSW